MKRGRSSTFVHSDSSVTQALSEASLAVYNQQSYPQFFHRLTGKLPYHYQEELAKELFQGRSCVLRAPTGSGKTWATLAPFLYGRVTGCPSIAVDRVIYALPLRSLASSLHGTILRKVKELPDPALTLSSCGR